MDQIFFKQMGFYGYHGVFQEENRLGQRFVIDLELGLDLHPAALADDLKQTVNYGEVYQVVQEEVEGKPVKLIETLAENIANRLLEKFPIQQVKLSVAKPHPPIAGHYQAVGVEMIRRRQVKAYLGLGSNLGDRLQQMQQAITALGGTEGIEVTRLSSIYQTAPVGNQDQPDFYNMVVEIETAFSPSQLLAATLQIEKKMHRIRQARWGPRTIDIDLLLYGEDLIQLEDLQIPHPRMMERAFVLIPLYELIGNQLLPGTEKTLEEWMEQLPPEQEVQILSETLDV